MCVTEQCHSFSLRNKKCSNDALKLFYLNVIDDSIQSDSCVKAMFIKKIKYY